MKLELKHLSPYLPYRLPFYQEWSAKQGIKVELTMLDMNRFADFTNLEGIWLIDDLKPILIPLSDLTKEIEVNGKKFVPIEILSAYSTEIELLHDIKYGFISVIFWDMLLSWHFDVFGLIDTGLAVDINTVKF
jgi:hypothetical protein